MTDIWQIPVGGSLETQLPRLNTKINKMPEVKIKHENPASGDVLLTAGLRVRTKWGWTAKVKEVVPEHFKYGQGVTVKRGYDGKLFSIIPSEIDWACR